MSDGGRRTRNRAVGSLVALCVFPGLACEAPVEPAGGVEHVSGAVQGENLAGNNLGGVNLGGVNLAGNNLGGVNLGGNNLGGVNMAGSNLGGTNLAGNNLGGVNLGGSNLGGVNLGGVNLGGVNLGGVNLGGSNLGGSNLGGVNLAGNNLGGTNLGGVNLGGVNTGRNIHSLASANGMLYSGEDLWSTVTARSVVAGIGSTAFAKLLGQQSPSCSKIYVALGRLPWGFSNNAGSPKVLDAWEAVVWGDTTYSVFVLAAPPSVNWMGVAGFIKAVFRWNAPPTQSMDISGIEASLPIDPTTSTAIHTYAGMMDVAAKFRAGTVNENAFVAGLLAFASATTNNQSVLVDFASWVRDTSNAGIVLGNVDTLNPPKYAEALYIALDMGGGNVKVVIDDTASRTSVMPAGTLNAIWELDLAYQAFKAGIAPKPVPKRCGGALYLNKRYGEAIPAGKCDSGLDWNPGFCARGGAKWASVTGAGAPAMNNYMQLTKSSAPYLRTLDLDGNSCGSNLLPVISETYVHTFERPYDITGACTPESNASLCARRGLTCGSVTADDNCGTERTVSCGAACAAPAVATYQAEGLGATIGGFAYALVCSKFSASDSAYAASGCTRGEIVRSIGTNASGSGGHVTINEVSAPSAGTYYLRMWSAVGPHLGGPGTRKMYISVNGAAASTVSVTGSDWNTPVPTVTTVQLAAGLNTIKFYNPNTDTWAPDLDRIEVVNTPNTNPWPWAHADIGAVGLAGSMADSGSAFTITASGADVWGTADEFHMAYQSLTGNGSVTARVASISGAQAFAKALVMMRDGTSAGARYVAALVTPAAANGYRMQYRSSAGGTSVSAFTGTSAVPAYLRVTRAGDTFTAAYSTDGATFTTIGTAQTIDLPDTVLVGVGVTSHDDAAVATASFDHVSVGVASCVAETDAAFCSRAAKNCGSVTAADNCGTSRTVASCGTCASPQSCGGGGTANVCGGASANLFANPTFSGGNVNGWTTYFYPGAGSLAYDATGQDGNGSAKISIPSTYTADIDWHAQMYQAFTADGGAYNLAFYFQKTEGSSKSITVFCEQEGGAYTVWSQKTCTNSTGWTQCTLSCTPPAGVLTKFGIAAALDDVDMRIDALSLTRNTGATCTPESNAAFCSRLAKNCGSVTGADNCGTSRTVSSCGSCSSPQTCGGGGTANVCGGGTSNLFSNASFASGTTGWSYYSYAGGSIASNATAQDGDAKSLKYTIGTYSGTTWDMQQIFQTKTANGSPYTVKFYFQKTEGTASKSATVFCSENGAPYTLYNSATCSNSSGWTVCQTTCTPPSGKSVKFGIGLGTNNVDILIDNGSLTQ